MMDDNEFFNRIVCVKCGSRCEVKTSNLEGEEIMYHYFCGCGFWVNSNVKIKLVKREDR